MFSSLTSILPDTSEGWEGTPGRPLIWSGNLWEAMNSPPSPALTSWKNGSLPRMLCCFHVPCEQGIKDRQWIPTVSSKSLWPLQRNNVVIVENARLAGGLLQRKITLRDVNNDIFNKYVSNKTMSARCDRALDKGVLPYWQAQADWCRERTFVWL